MESIDIDLTYVISEVQDIQGELGAKDAMLTDLANRLEGVEARLKEVVDALLEYSSDVPGSPIYAGEILRGRLQG